MATQTAARPWRPIRLNPLSGMYDGFAAAILGVTLGLISMFVGGWLRGVLGVMAGILLLYFVMRVRGRTSKKWARLHYPALIEYSAVAGAQRPFVSATEEFDVQRAVITLIRYVCPTWDEAAAHALLQRAISRMDTFSDRQVIEAYAKRRFRNATEAQHQNTLAQLQERFRAHSAGDIVRFTLAEMVELEYGASERSSYVCAFLGGEAL